MSIFIISIKFYRWSDYIWLPIYRNLIITNALSLILQKMADLAAILNYNTWRHGSSSGALLPYNLIDVTTGVRDVDLEEDSTRRPDGWLLTEEVLEDIVPIVDQRCGPIDRVVFVPVRCQK